MANSDAVSVRATIERHNAFAGQCYARGDVDALASLFTADAWQMAPNNPPLVGRDAIREFWRAAVQWGSWSFALATQAVEVSGPLAVERGSYVLRFAAGAGAPPGVASFEDRGNYLAHWRHEADGEWRAAGDAPVSALPLPHPDPGASQGPLFE